MTPPRLAWLAAALGALARLRGALTASPRVAVIGAGFRAGMRRHAPKLLSGAARGMLGSPWLAVATGTVIAAGAFFYSPHAQYVTQKAVPNVTHCKPSSCPTLVPDEIASQPATQPNEQDHGAKAEATPAGAVLQYRVTYTQYGLFRAQIVIPQAVAGGWQLSFVLPNGQVGSVGGASGSQSPGSDKVTLSGQSAGTVQLWGMGSAANPADCFLNGASCSFSQPVTPDWRVRLSSRGR